MVFKELEEILAPELFKQSERKGYESEKQMAFYLRDKFADHKDIHVLNNLHIKKQNGNGFFQIDHLIVTKYCFIVVNSKNYRNEVAYDEAGQWSYLSSLDKKWHGMDSPVIQTENEGEALRAVLQANREDLRLKFLFLQGGFLGLPIHTLIGFSNNGIIRHPKKAIFKDVALKADMVAQKILDIYQEYIKKDGATTLQKIGHVIADKNPTYILPQKDLKKSIDFLISLHKTQIAYKKLNVIKIAKCRKCGGVQEFQKNDAKIYGLKCSNCRKIKNLNTKCQTCSGTLEIKRYNGIFTVACDCCEAAAKLV